MKRMCTLLFALMSGAILAAPDGSACLDFNTIQGVRQATALLRVHGLTSFMDDAWRQGVVSPGIHSKYWVDQLDQNALELKAIESAYRDFGREVAQQLDEVAAEIYTRPNRAQERKRLDWLLRFARWIRSPGKFENYRIAFRAENAATIPLLRMIVDTSIPENEIESAFSRFLSFRESAAMRAEIVFEESAGILDLRDLAEIAVEPDDGFEKRWIQLHREAYRHFNNRLLHYSQDIALLKNEERKYTFPLDDEITSHNATNRWDAKLHKLVCVFSVQPMYLKQLKKVFEFRKLVGSFPDVEVPLGADMCQTYENYYNKKFKSCWTEHKVWPGYAAIYYTHAKKNSYADEETYKFVASRKK